MDQKKEYALKKHAKWKGNLSVECKCPITNKEELAVAYTPGVAEPCLESAQLLSDAMQSFRLHCADGIRPNREKIAKLAHKENLTLKEAALKLQLVSEDDFAAWVNPKKMV